MVSALLCGLFSPLVLHCQRSKGSTALLFRSAAFCCRLGTKSHWPDFCPSSRIHESPITIHSSQFSPPMRVFPSNCHYRGSNHGQSRAPQDSKKGRWGLGIVGGTPVWLLAIFSEEAS